MERVASAASHEGYDAFAYAYDQALGRTFFENLLPHLERVAARHVQGRSVRHIDLACGTGHLVRWMRERGAWSAGVDLSLPMLQPAVRRSGRRVIAGDLRALPLRGTFDVVTSMYDSLNHLLERDDLVRAFQAARALMNERSTFWFDMNHPSAYTRVWSIREPFVAAGPDFRLAIHTSYERTRRLATGWVEGHADINGSRVMIDEVHHQRSYTEREIRSALRSARLRVVEQFRFDPFGAGQEPVKLFFVVRAE